MVALQKVSFPLLVGVSGMEMGGTLGPVDKCTDECLVEFHSARQATGLGPDEFVGPEHARFTPSN
jgi:hypothetical protein